ncbi:MAG: fimbrial protein [Fibrobacter sp.]|nr:fimbrial protein [Fibrobacter sp.]
MKNAYNSILVLTVVGLLVLVAGALYFGAPLFGWIIMAAIFAVFIIDQFRLLSALKSIRSEEGEIESCERSGMYAVAGDGVVARRLKLARDLMGKGVRLDSAIAFEVLSNNASVAAPRSSGGAVILLGLMGTFFGLMYSVATAGGAIDNSTTQGTLDTIQVLFQNMKGIFGTSLCGLFAALVLGASRGLFLGTRDAFIARLDTLTLNLQGESAGENEKSKDELGRLFDSVEKNLARVAESVQQGLNGIVSKVGEELSTSTAKLNADMGSMVAKLEGSLGNLGGTVGTDVANALNPLNDYMKNLQASVESLPAKLDEKLNGISTTLKTSLDGVAASTEKSMDGAVKNIAESVASQVKQSDEQWKAFMDKLASETSANVDSQKEGLETLKNVALQVAEKAQAGSAELSQSVAEKLNTLSSDILSAFQKLSETTATLLEAQKALTESIDNRVVKEKEATDALGGNIVETAELMRVNQSELSANLEMLRAGLETILEKLSGDTAEHEDEENFVEHLNQSLEAFHERASEVLMENAVKTQEILLEVLEQTQRAARQATPKAEG